MKIVILGGSAFSTPSLFSYLASQACIDGFEIAMVGRSRERTLAIERAARLICNGCAISVSSSGMSSKELEVLLPGTDVVLLQIRPGGHIARAADEVFPHKYALCGDEGLGPSGLRAAWRIWPAVYPLLSAVANLCPGALVMILTAPLSLMTRMAHSCFPGINLIGVCELPWTTLKKISFRAGLEAKQLDFDYIGTNHLGWFYRLRVGSRDLLADYSIHQNIEDTFPSSELVESLSAIPTSYLRLHYLPRQELCRQKKQPMCRGTQLHELSRKVISICRNGKREDIVASLGLRPAPWYADAIGPLIIARHTGLPSVPVFLSVRNEGFDPRFRDDDVLEAAHDCRGKTLVRRKAQSHPPPKLYETLAKFVEFERVAAEANMHRDRQRLADAIALHPWIDDLSKVAPMVQDITENNSAL
jgi:6-phospho-beta-glucosidase